MTPLNRPEPGSFWSQKRLQLQVRYLHPLTNHLGLLLDRFARSASLRVHTYLSTILIVFGTTLLNPSWSTFAASPAAWSLFATAPYMTENRWGLLMAALGVCGLIVNWTSYKRYAKIILSIKSWVLLSLALMFFIGSPGNTGTGTYAILGLATLIESAFFDRDRRH